MRGERCNKYYCGPVQSPVVRVSCRRCKPAFFGSFAKKARHARSRLRGVHRVGALVALRRTRGDDPAGGGPSESPRRLHPRDGDVSRPESTMVARESC